MSSFQRLSHLGSSTWLPSPKMSSFFYILPVVIACFTVKYIFLFPFYFTTITGNVIHRWRTFTIWRKWTQRRIIPSFAEKRTSQAQGGFEANTTRWVLFIFVCLKSRKKYQLFTNWFIARIHGSETERRKHRPTQTFYRPPRGNAD